MLSSSENQNEKKTLEHEKWEDVAIKLLPYFVLLKLDKNLAFSSSPVISATHLRRGAAITTGKN